MTRSSNGGQIRWTNLRGSGQTGFPTPRRVRHDPFVQLRAPVVWTTLALTIHADGTTEQQLTGASSFPRHWVYDHAGRLVAKSGFIDYDTWWREAFGVHTPWGDEDSAPIVTAVESSLERQLSVAVIDAKPQFRRLQAGRNLVEQGDQGEDLFLLFDGVLRVEVDGKPVTEVGPGAILGELALLREGRRTATLRAVTPCRVAVVPKNQIDRQALEEVATGRVRRMPATTARRVTQESPMTGALITVHAGNASNLPPPSCFRPLPTLVAPVRRAVPRVLRTRIS